MNPMDVINKINEIFDIVIKNRNLNGNSSSVFEYYSGDFCMLLLKFYPSATIMIDKTYNKCALLINGVLYNSKGIVNIDEYKIADKEDINYIRLGLNELSEDIYNEICQILYCDNIVIPQAYTLRKNSNYLS